MSLAATNPDNYFKGGAKVYFDQEDDNGDPTGERYLGSIKTIGSQLVQTLIEAKDYALAVPQIVKSTPSDRKLEISLELQEADLENLKLGLSGTIVPGTQAATPVVDQPILNVEPGKWYATGKRHISAVVVKEGVITLTIGTDYLVDLAFGLVYVVPGGALISGDDLLVSYTPTAQAVNKVTIGTKAVIEGRLVIRSIPASGSQYEGTYWRTQLSPDGEYPWISEEYGTFKLKATVLADASNHPGNELGEIVEI
jgi:hypothetical protein